MGMLTFREPDYNCGRKGIPQLKNSIEKKVILVVWRVVEQAFYKAVNKLDKECQTGLTDV